MSQTEVNAGIRVLSDKPLKYTALVHKPDGSKIEFQTEREPAIKWHDESRSLWLHVAPESYTHIPCMKWEDGFILTCEKNPRPD